MAGPNINVNLNVKDLQDFSSWPVAAKGFLAIVFVGVVCALYYFVAYTPLEEEIAAADAAHLKGVQDLAAAQERQSEFIRVRGELDGRAAIDRQNKRILPERAEIPAFLQDLNRLAELSGLKIGLVEPRPEEEGESYVKIPVALKLHGSYHQLAKFFYNVTKLDRAISMENIELADPKVTGEDVTLSVQVLATTYRIPVIEKKKPGVAGARRTR